jgi:hypothetical protein
LGELGVVGLDSSSHVVSLVLFIAPAIVDVDVLVPKILEAQGDQKRTSCQEHGLVYVAFVLVP